MKMETQHIKTYEMQQINVKSEVSNKHIYQENLK